MIIPTYKTAYHNCPTKTGDIIIGEVFKCFSIVLQKKLKITIAKNVKGIRATKLAAITSGSTILLRSMGSNVI